MITIAAGKLSRGATSFPRLMNAIGGDSGFQIRVFPNTWVKRTQDRAMFETNRIVIRKALVTLPNGVNLPSVLTIEAQRIQGHAE